MEPAVSGKTPHRLVSRASPPDATNSRPHTRRPTSAALVDVATTDVVIREVRPHIVLRGTGNIQRLADPSVNLCRDLRLRNRRRDRHRLSQSSRPDAVRNARSDQQQHDDPPALHTDAVPRERLSADAPGCPIATLRRWLYIYEHTLKVVFRGSPPNVPRQSHPKKMPSGKCSAPRLVRAGNQQSKSIYSIGGIG
jgi:hypothetical protein